MAIPIKIPDIGTTVEEVTIVRWRKKIGDFIKKGEIIAEIETDKAVVELESIAEGKIVDILYKEGETIKQGSVIAYVDREDGIDKERQFSKISPTLKNLAEKLGVNIDHIKINRPDGLITRDDILQAAKKSSETLPLRKQISLYQKTIIKKVTKSHLEIPAVYFTSSIIMDKIIEFRANVLKEKNIKIYYDAFFIFSCAKCIGRMPVMNRFILGDSMGERERISIAFAASFKDRLFTPVIHNADCLTLFEINKNIDEMLRKIEQGTIRTEEMEGACFLISNLGMYPIDQFNAIIYPGHSGVLAIGKISKKFVIENDTPIIRNICNVTLACDHRIVNGTTAGQFLRELKDFMESGSFREE
ncbi:MAG: 2-oxo acid dehydrogenase subunit E2 [bacterium]|nr:2-oxo acid dehydrogenase subunit E2 [bacterium]